MSWLGRFVHNRVANGFESSLDELFALISEMMIDCRHGLNRARRRPAEGELTVDHLAFTEGECPVAKNDKPAGLELAAEVFVKIKNDFFVRE